MINRLKFTVTFPTTGKTITGDHTFVAGLTAISGLNESGKSLRLEFIRFALFGAAALRASLSKYKALSVELDFTVKDVDYRIERKTSNTKLFRLISSPLSALASCDPYKDPIAVGTKPVNIKIAELFGYGLSVFDTAHSINQGQIEALGAMPPAERKAMVDSVIGLNVLDNLIKYAGETAMGFAREFATLESTLVKPIKPVKPEDYNPSTNLAQAIRFLECMKSEHDQLLGSLRNEPACPTAPEPCPVTHTVEDLELVMRVRAERAMLQVKHDAIPDVHYTLDELDTFTVQDIHHNEWLAYQKKLAAFPVQLGPMMTLEFIKTRREWLAKYQAWEAATEKWNRHKIECPNCEHTWSDKLVKPDDYMEKPDFTKAMLDEDERSVKAWSKAPAPVPQVDAPPLTAPEIRAERKALADAAGKIQLAARLAELGDPPDVSSELKVRREHDKQTALYEQRLASWQAFQDMKATALARLAELGEVDTRLATTQSAYQVALFYEQSLNAYNVAQIHYVNARDRRDEAKAKSEGYKKAREALTILKAMVKAHLVPSLSRVASTLIGQMTGGERGSIAVNEDFDVKVDGQDLDELSGSAKAVANLSIRLGLGMVLTNRVFPVLMADEVDAAMDVDRAGYTAECLHGLLGKTSQIVLVSHKKIDADHTIELGAAA